MFVKKKIQASKKQIQAIGSEDRELLPQVFQAISPSHRMVFEQKIPKKSLSKTGILATKTGFQMESI